ncbi:hypothetical protein Dimus_038371 [Dionaea muscipula]
MMGDIRRVGGVRAEIPCFTEKSDFGIWKKKMKALLSNERLISALDKETDSKKSVTESSDTAKTYEIKRQICEDAYNLIILNLSDSVLRKVDDCNTAIELWDKLESLYAKQSAPNLAYLKGTLFSWKMDMSKSLEDNIDEFIKLTLILKGTDQAIDDTSQAIILLQSLPEEYAVVKNSLKYSGTTPTVELVLSGLRARELKLNINKRGSHGLFVKHKSAKKNFQ